MTPGATEISGPEPAVLPLLRGAAAGGTHPARGPAFRGHAEPGTSAEFHGPGNPLKKPVLHQKTVVFIL